MDLIDELTSRLNSVPGARYESDSSSITVFPNNTDGFTVSFTKNFDTYTVFFNGWHEDFQSADEAVGVFGFGLSDQCRLRESRRGSYTYKWTVESLEEEEWQEQSTTALLIFPFWRRRKVYYLQNSLLSPHDSLVEKLP